MRQAACRSACSRGRAIPRLGGRLAAALMLALAFPLEAQELYELVVPVRVNGTIRGMVSITIDGSDESLVDVDAGIMDLIAEYDPERALRLIDLDEEATSTPGRLDAYQLQDLGMKAFFDASKVELSLELDPVARRIARHPASRIAKPVTVTLEEAPVGGGMNLKTTTGMTTSTREEADPDYSVSLRGEAFLTVHKWVAEADATFETTEDGPDFEMGDWVLTRDVVAARLRLQAGTVKYPVVTNQRRLPIYGVAAFSTFAFDPAYRADRYEISFFLDRTSEVTVTKDGKVVFSERLPAGPHVITDIPITTGTNEIELKADGVELRYEVPYEGTLLKKGAWLYGAALGALESDLLVPVLAGYLRHGFTSSITGEAFIHADASTQALGADAVFALPLGSLLGSAAANHTYTPENGHGFGALGHVGYRAQNMGGKGLNFNGILDARTPWFIPAGKLLYPNESFLSASLGLSGPLPKIPVQVDGGVSADFYYDPDDTRFSLWMGASARIGSRFTVNGALRFSPLPLDSVKKVRADLSLRYVPGGPFQELSFSQSFDRPESVFGVKGATIPLTTGDLNWSGEFKSPVFLDADEGLDVLEAGGMVQYQGTRIDAKYAHALDVNEIGANDTETINRMRLDLDSGFVFAGPVFAWTAPTARNFLIIRGTEAFKDIPVGIPSGNAWAVKTDLFGPVAVSGLSAYRPRRVEVLPAEVPEGHQPDKAVHTLMPGYRSAYHISVGGKATIQLAGSLRGPDGKAMEFTAGTLTQADVENPIVLRFFTVEEGAFEVDGLLPGAWIIELSGSEASYRVEIPADAAGRFDAGPLMLEEGDR